MTANESHGPTNEIEEQLQKVNIHTSMGKSYRGNVYANGKKLRGDIYPLVDGYSVVDVGRGNQLAKQKSHFLRGKVPHVLGHHLTTEQAPASLDRVLAELKRLPVRPEKKETAVP